DCGIVPNIPLTRKTRRPSTAAAVWEEDRDHHPFLDAWLQAEEVAKLLQVVPPLRHGTGHPDYHVLTPSRRTACRSPNIQQIPKEDGFRELFVPTPGHFLLTVDYNCIELRTLATTCLHRYGWSDLAEVFRAGGDPHAHTAAMMLSVSPEEFLAWKSDPERKEQDDAARQGGKPVNFGVPGGLGAASLVNYARNSYGVQLTLDEARERRGFLTTKTYRELDLYLAEDVHAIVARNLKAALDEVRGVLGEVH